MFTLKEIMKFVSNWQVWMSFFLIFAPGLIYQLDHRHLILANYSGTLIIALLIQSFFYSMPFIVLGFCAHVGLLLPTDQIKSRKLNQGDFFSMSVFASAFYAIMDTIDARLPYTLTQSFVMTIIALIILISLFQLFKK